MHNDTMLFTSNKAGIFQEGGKKAGYGFLFLRKDRPVRTASSKEEAQIRFQIFALQ